jgi:hypothetical protein
MAEIVDIAGDGPVNDGEQRVLDALVEQLGPEVRIIPNWTVVHPGNLDECDAIVVTNDAVFIVETKDLAGDVEVEQNEFIYNEKLRPHPYHQTHKKAQRLRSKLNGLLPVFGSNGWVEPQVVFARQPNSLYVDPLMADRFIAIGQVGSMLGSNSPRIHPNQHGRLSGLIDQVVEAITSGGRLRDREKFVVDGIRAVGGDKQADRARGCTRARPPSAGDGTPRTGDVEIENGVALSHGGADWPAHESAGGNGRLLPRRWNDRPGLAVSDGVGVEGAARERLQVRGGGDELNGP